MELLKILFLVCKLTENDVECFHQLVKATQRRCYNFVSNVPQNTPQFPYGCILFTQANATYLTSCRHDSLKV